MNRIGNDLIAAYEGVHEDDTSFDQEPGRDFWIRSKIQNDSPKERLDTYLQWNGILGWTDRIWELSQGEL